MDDGTDPMGAAASERRQLLALCYRMLGTVTEAEDAVQETYLRWLRLSDSDRAVIENPQAWLTRVASRVCLDVLGSARVRRESYVGEWLPEPVPSGFFLGSAPTPDPLERLSLDEAVSTALLVVLDSLTPPQRVAFVLHDAFGMPFDEIAAVVGRTPEAVRKLASVARGRVHDRHARTAFHERHDAAVAAFALACRQGDLAALIAVLDPQVELRSDGGGTVSAARRPVVGSDRVARFLLGVLAKEAGTAVAPLVTADGSGFALVRDGVLTGILNLRVVDDRIAEVWFVLNPAKLSAWRGVPFVDRSGAEVAG